MAIIEQGILTSGVITTALLVTNVMGEYIQAMFQLPFIK